MPVIGAGSASGALAAVFSLTLLSFESLRVVMIDTLLFEFVILVQLSAQPGNVSIHRRVLRNSAFVPIDSPKTQCNDCASITIAPGRWICSFLVPKRTLVVYETTKVRWHSLSKTSTYVGQKPTVAKLPSTTGFIKTTYSKAPSMTHRERQTTRIRRLCTTFAGSEWVDLLQRAANDSSRESINQKTAVTAFHQAPQSPER